MDDFFATMRQSLNNFFFSVGWGFFSPCLVLLDARHHAVFLFFATR